MSANRAPFESAEALLHSVSTIFWDFDGVIKESVVVKAIGFEQLFLPYGRELAARVRQHHEAHSGVSRFEKMPLYLGWAGEVATEAHIADFCDRFSQLVIQAVIDAAWVPGVREYLLANHLQQTFILITATPEPEILQILAALELRDCFREVHGSPTPKAAAIRHLLGRGQCAPQEMLVVGDSEADLRAAEENHVAFLLRRTPLNASLQLKHRGPTFDYLTHG